jgi:cytidylate kinase
MDSKNSITISRQFGCGGAKIGQLVAAQLGFCYADRKVLHVAAESLGFTAEEKSARNDRMESFWEKIAALFAHNLHDIPYMAPPFQASMDERLFAMEGKIIQELASREDCVVVGRAGVHVLRGHPGSVHIFLHAPERFRIRRVMDIYGVPTEEKALAMIQESDRARREYLNRMARYDWFYATNYNLVLDTSAISFEQAAGIIVNYVYLKTGRRACFPVESVPANNRTDMEVKG